jgi:hypothetical protein
MLTRVVVACAIAMTSGAAVGCTAGQSPESRLIDQAAAALGDGDKVRDVRTMVLEGDGGDLRARGEPDVRWAAVEVGGPASR